MRWTASTTTIFRSIATTSTSRGGSARRAPVVVAPYAAIFHDKRITTVGGVRHSEVEAYYSAIAGLTLARRYARSDIEELMTNWIVGNGEEPHRRALEDFRARDRAGETPEPFVGADHVAQFVGGVYAEHRF